MREIIRTEAELCEKVNAYFSDWELYSEVPVEGGTVDIVCVKGPVHMHVEAKLKFNFQVIEQAYRNRAYSHFSYLAVPQPKIFQPFILKVCREWGIGVLFVNPNSTIVVTEVVRPRMNRKIKKLKLEDWMKNSIAGSLHGRETAYSHAMGQIVHLLQRSAGGKCLINEVFKKTSYHWSSPSSAKQCILSYIRKGIIKNIKHDKGYLVLIRNLKK